MTKAIDASEIKALRKVLESITSNVKNTVAQCIAAGKLLTQIKTKTKHGDWNHVLESVDLAFNTAERYMLLWEHRTKLDLSKVRTLIEASELISKISSLEIRTSQNQQLTYEKGSISEGEKRPDFGHNAGRVGPTRRASDEDQKTGIKGGFQADAIPRDNSRAYVSGNDLFHMEPDEIDPVDKISRSTPGDVAVAAQISLERTEGYCITEGTEYPKVFSFEVLCQEEEVQFSVVAEKILVKRGQKNGHGKIDVHKAIVSVCNAYKETTGKTLSVKPLDAGQLRRLLQSGITLEEFIGVGQKAWKSNGFLAAGQSHQLATFVKHYGNIRNEVAGPAHRGNPRPGADRNAGTANQNRIGQYDGVGRVL